MDEDVFLTVISHNKAEAFFRFVPFNDTAHCNGAVGVFCGVHHIDFAGVDDLCDGFDLFAFVAVKDFAIEDSAFA